MAIGIWSGAVDSIFHFIERDYAKAAHERKSRGITIQDALPDVTGNVKSDMEKNIQTAKNTETLLTLSLFLAAGYALFAMRNK